MPVSNVVASSEDAASAEALTDKTYGSKSKSSKEGTGKDKKKISPIICVMLDPDNQYENASDTDRLEMIRNLIIHLKAGKMFLESKMKFDSAEEMFKHYAKNTLNINNKDILLTRGVGLTDWEFEHKSVRVGKLIGRGQFGEVRRGKLTLKNGKNVYVAIKSIKTDADISKDLIKKVMKEARLMRGLHHPNVVTIYGVGLLEQPLYILLEYVAGGALKSYLRKNKDAITMSEKIQMVLGAAWGIDYLHKVNIIHRDIAARNCLYDHDSAVKISDFGLSRAGTEYKMKTATKMPIRWMAPECISSFMFTRKSDVYSFGVLIYEIYAFKDPYTDVPAAAVRKKITDGELNDFPSGTPEDLIKYVKDKLWCKDPDKREDMEQVCDWLEGYAGLNAVSFGEDPDTQPTSHGVSKKDVASIASTNPKATIDMRKMQVFMKLRKQNKSYEQKRTVTRSQDQSEAP